MIERHYIPGGNWQVACLDDEGGVWSEPVIAWEFRGGVGCPVLATIGTVLVGDPDLDSNSGYWLVPPGEKPETSRYRPTAENGAAR
ncbi:hypothetical protein OG689_27625 [Kitasatospora sp. NBC_00240]|uniref:hypothetical protein n=1 Tax=Kitasatospora sp. NBC_00240 TaxID=2903567 RepID=UPI002251F481|nr:hypothetical protein [Kitasatospora sp. NBC_00240]MCX5212994.1 hypothetical protein [Kitasatospora sp. NBC_00240]